MPHGEVLQRYSINVGKYGFTKCVYTFKFFVLMVLAVSCSSELETSQVATMHQQQSQFTLDENTFSAILEVNNDIFIRYINILQIPLNTINEILSWLKTDYGIVYGRIKELDEEILESQHGYINTNPKLVEERKELRVEHDDILQKIDLLEQYILPNMGDNS